MKGRFARNVVVTLAVGVALLIAILGLAGLTAESAPSLPKIAQVPVPPQPQAAASTPVARISDALDRETFVVAARVNGYSHIWAQVLGEPNAFQLTAGSWDDRNPVVNPSVDQIAFASRKSGNWDLYVMDLETGEVQQVTDTPGYEGKPTWSPDGLWVAYEAYYEDNFDIWILPLDGSQSPIQLTNNPGSDTAPAWDPGGRRIAFVSDRSGSPDIYIADLDKPTDRFSNITKSPLIEELDPAFNSDGSQIAFSVQVEGIYGIQRMPTDVDESPAKWVGQGSDPVWSGNGKSIAGILRTPYTSHIVTYPLEQSIPPGSGTLSGRISELDWSPQAFLKLGSYPIVNSEPLFEPVQDEPSTVGDRLVLVALANVTPSGLRLSDAADEAFDALRLRILNESGWDFLSNLQRAFVGINEPLPPGYAYNDWLYTGRAFSISQAAVQAGWVEVVREEFGLETFWHVYVRASVQDGSLGEPLRSLPWDFTSRYIGDPIAYDAGGSRQPTIPEGYYIDFTALAADYGFVRLPAMPNWRSFYPGARFDEFALMEGLDWTSAMHELYPASAIATPTPYQTPTTTPTNTPRPTPTPWWWRWRTPTPTLGQTATP
ncbi:MAG: TolB family protein [Anaerolineales bacterium]